METRNDDNNLENYFFELALKKDIIRHQLNEIYEVIIKENDNGEDIWEKSIFTYESLIKSYIFWSKPLEWLDIKDKDYIWKLFFGNEFPWIDMMDAYIDFDVSKDIEDFRNSSIEKQWIVFYTIFSIIENLINIKDEDFSYFLMNQYKETAEIDLLYIIEKALKVFEMNTREILHKLRDYFEKQNLNEPFTIEDFTQFKEGISLLTENIIENFKTNSLISEDISKFQQMKENYEKILKAR